jgi:hypothetical protein
VDAGHPEAEQILKLKYLNIQRIILTHGISKELEARQAELEKDLFEFAQEDVVYSYRFFRLPVCCCCPHAR